MKKKTKKALKEAAKEIVKVIIATILAITGVSLQSCGVTKAYIRNARGAASTTITITTNNPITTNVDPSANVDLKSSKL